MKRKSQTFLLVCLLLLIASILATALAKMWESTIQINASERDGIIAFYLAQAGLERAKIAVIYNPNRKDLIGWQPGSPPKGGYNLDTDRFQYNFSWNDHEKKITAQGWVLDSNDNILAQKELSVIVEHIDDKKFEAKIKKESWQEQ